MKGWIRIRIKVKCRIGIRNEVKLDPDPHYIDADPQPWLPD